MTRIALVVSDVDGTLLTKDKTLTDAARGAVRRLHDAGIGFTITSSRPTIGMRFLIEPLQITLPVGAFNGSSIVDPQLNPIEQHLIPPAAARRSLDVLNEFGVDIWLFTNELWLTRRGDGEYVPLEKRAIRHDPTVVADFTPYLTSRLQDRRLQLRCGVAAALRGRDAAGVGHAGYRGPIANLLSRRHAARLRQGHLCARRSPKRLGISTDAVATIGDMQNDLAMFRKSGISIAMGNATDDVKRLAHPCHALQRRRRLCREPSILS